MDDDLKKMICCFCTTFIVGLVVFFLIFILGSLQTLEITEVGLDFDTTKVSINNQKLFEGGRHFLGLTHQFLTFQTNLQQMSFDGTQYNAISSRSKDGLESTINISYQYKLVLETESLLQLFYFFPDEDYTSAYYRITRNTVRDTTARYTAFEQVYNRTLIEQAMREDLTKSLQAFYADVQNFQLLEISYPSSFETAISESQKEYFQIQEATQNKSKAEAEAEGAIRRANTEAEVIYNNAQVEATKIVQGAEGEAAAIQQRILAQTPSFESLTNDLNLRDKALIAFQWINSMKALNARGTKLKVMMETPSKMRCMFDQTQTSC